MQQLNEKYNVVKNNNVNMWEKDFYIAYNDAYRCYLQNQPPTCFMNVLLDKIAKITGSIAGFIINLYQIENDMYPNIEAIYRDEDYDDFILYNKNWKMTLDENSLCYKAILNDNIEILEDINEESLKSEPIHLILKKGSYICIPYKFNNKIIGILGLIRMEKFNYESFSSLNILCNLIGTLQNSYHNVKLTTKQNNKKLIIYQLLDDILNTVHDALIIVDDLFEIIHMNNYTTQLVSELYPKYGTFDTQNIDKLNMTLLELFPDIQIQLANEIGTTKKIYKNKKIDMTIESNNIKKILEFTINTVMCSGNFYHLITVYHKQDYNHYKQTQSTINEKKLIAFLSHELRNPLQSVTLANHLLKTNISKDEKILEMLSPKVTTYLDIINKSCEDMKKIINDILDLSRLESNDFLIEMEICDVDELLDSLIDEYNGQALSKKIILEKKIGDNVPLSIYTDITRSRQILSNLISNAVKYSSPDGTITIDVTSNSETTPTAKKHIKFSVVDKGDGINENDVDKLFKTYGQTSLGKKNMSSQGLGLCVSQKIANLLGGKITVKSEVARGSTFSFYHPIKLEPSANKYENDITVGKLCGSILLVDDNEHNLLLLHTLIEQFIYEYTWGVKIESVNSGEKAVEICKYNKYDIIFMDINMPGITGSTASTLIKSGGFGGKIIATTGNILSKNENRSMEQNQNYNNFDEVILKPFDDQTVLKILRKFLPADVNKNDIY